MRSLLSVFSETPMFSAIFQDQPQRNLNSAAALPRPFPSLAPIRFHIDPAAETESGEKHDKPAPP